MGYTHYWSQHRDFLTKEWKQVCNKIKLMLELAEKDGIKLGDGLGEDSPIINSKEIVFNGHTPEAYETFYLSKVRRPKDDRTTQDDYDERGAFNFCKTQYRPYDPVVVSVLAYLSQAFPSVISVASDGGDEVFTDDAKYL